MPRRFDPSDPEYRPPDSDYGPLFAQTPLRSMAHRDDPPEAKQAAVAIHDELPKLQLIVWRAFVHHGPMTAKEAEALPEFAGYGFSTVRKRVSELRSMGMLTATGTVREGSAECEATRGEQG